MREKEGKGRDWKQKVTQNIKTTGEVLKRHANKVSNRIRQWWRRMKKKAFPKKKAVPKKKAKSGKSEL